MGEQTRQLWNIIKDAVNNIDDLPSWEQAKELKRVIDLYGLSIRGTINVKGTIREMVRCGLNPLPNLEGLAEEYCT